MNYPAIAISAVSLLLSIFTFYWTTLRKRNAFFLLRTSGMSFDMSPQFALVNGGKSDLLITELTCILSNPDTGAGLIPSQRIETDAGKEWLLSAGKAKHCFGRFLESVEVGKLDKGRRDPKRLDLYFFNLDIMVEWVEMNGTMKRKTITLSEYGIDAQGNIRMSSPRGHRYDLNDSADAAGMGARLKRLLNR